MSSGAAWARPGAPQLLSPLRAAKTHTHEDMVWALKAMQKAYNAVGITSTIDRAEGPEGFRVYQELRDRKVALFIDKLPQGVWEIKYEMRAEVPGQFHALPVLGHAMYVPEIRCNGAEIRIKAEDRK